MPRAVCASEPVIFRATSGVCSFRTIIRATSRGRRIANQERISANIRPRAHKAGGAVREGAALLQGLAVCGRCGRRLNVFYNGRNATPSYYCGAGRVIDGRGIAVCKWVASRSMRPSPPRFSPRSYPLVCRRRRGRPALEADHDAALAQARWTRTRPL